MRCNLCTRHFYPRSPCGERPRLKLSGFCLCIISIHALLAESDGDGFVYCDTDSVFLSTLSLRRATTSNVVIRESTYISIHALLAESDRGWCFISAFPQTFLSTLSLRRATGYPGGKACAGLFLSTLSLRRATLAISAHCFDGRISIHALLAESDVAALGGHGHPRISIHALLAESDSSRCGISARWTNFYPRSPCGERPNP